MEYRYEQLKIKEARYLIIIPLFITAVCAWIDFLTGFTAGKYAGNDAKAIVIEIMRFAMGYFFPSLLSIVVAMIWQQIEMKDVGYGIKKNKTGQCVWATIIYALCFISCLIKYNLLAGIIFWTVTVIYGIWVYKNCLNEKIKLRTKDDMDEYELLGNYLKRR